MTMRTRGILAVSLALVLAGAAFAEEKSRKQPPRGHGGEDEAVRDEARHPRTLIFDPWRDDPQTAECLQPPTDEEVWREMLKTRPDDPPLAENARKNARFSIEKIDEKVDPLKTYPLAGPCRMVHDLYKGFVTYDVQAPSNYPPPFVRTERVAGEDVYIKKDYLRREDATAEATPPASSTDQRQTAVEQKLDRILKALEDQHESPAPPNAAVPLDAQVAPVAIPEAKALAAAPSAPEPTASSQDTYRGRIIGPDGGPVLGATVKQVRFDDKDACTLTDADGRYALAFPDREGVSAALKVEVPGLARQVVRVNQTEQPTIRLKEGAAITGRVLYRGKPLNLVDVILTASKRDLPESLGSWRSSTDENGRFTFPNVPQGNEYGLYFSVDSLRNFGAIAPRHVRIGPKGVELDLSDIDVEPAHRIAGRVAFSDGLAIPDGMIAYVSVAGLGKSVARCPIDKEGKFAIDGLPTTTVTLWFTFENHQYKPQGYRISPRNRSYDLTMQSTLVGKLDHDISNLVIMFEPGEQDAVRMPLSSGDAAELKERAARPLAGVEGDDRKAP